MKSVDSKEVDLFLSHHAYIEVRAHFHSGELFGDWRITAFLGRGGSGEVYHAVNQQTGEEAALKVFARNADGSDAGAVVAGMRFKNEMRFLSAVKYASFPRFLAQGETDGRPWYVMELLKERELPSDDAGVADFILKISKCVQLLHSMGYVHRDIKPGNIMYRSDGTPVLVDMGLLKRLDSTEESIARKESALSVVDGKAVGVGTPRYAAPEQFIGGEISPAADIHALGMLINECFQGELKGCWEKIVARATSSIPERRYRDVPEVMQAVRHRHWHVFGIVVTGIVLSAGVLLSAFLPWWTNEGREQWNWHTLGESMTTNVVTEKMVPIEFGTTPAGSRYPTKWHCQYKTNSVAVTLVRLNGGTKVFKEPLRLRPGRETWIVGPGVLDAALECGEDGAKVRLENCLFNNRSKTLPSKSRIRYDLAGGVCLNFTEHEDDVRWRDCVEPFDGAYNDVRFKGPETIEEYNRLRQREFSAD